MSSEYLKTSKASYKVYKKYQTTIHGDPEEKVTEEQFTRFLVKSSLQVTVHTGLFRSIISYIIVMGKMLTNFLRRSLPNNSNFSIAVVYNWSKVDHLTMDCATYLFHLCELTSL